ncbi:MAG: GNAT family N-acetyltransferase [Nitrososphaerales archaeon]
MRKPSGGAPTAYEIRELRATDLGNGLVETLGNLSDTGGLTPATARKVLRTMKRSPLYHVLVAVNSDGQVMGATTLLVEQKFIHGGGLVGHIEDVTVRKGYEGRGVGGSLVKAAVEMAEELACYKCILDCKDELVGFYEKLGFRRHDVGMRVDFKRSR